MSDFLSRLSERALGLRPTAEPLLRVGGNRTPIATQDIGETESDGSVVQPAPTDHPSHEMASAGPAATEAQQRRTLTTVHDVIEKMYSVGDDTPMRDVASEQQTPIVIHEPIRSSVRENAPKLQFPREDTDHPESGPTSAPIRAREEPLDQRLTPLAMQRPTLLSTAPRAPRVSDPPLPALQVTIGRIDIHADPPTLRPTAAPAPRPTTLSLEDYLAHRRGRRP
jgi:hypothetical protein